MISKQYKCPKCGGEVVIIAKYDVDTEGYESISLEAICRNCKDTRYDSIDEMDYGKKIERLVNHLGVKL